MDAIFKSGRSKNEKKTLCGHSNKNYLVLPSLSTNNFSILYKTILEGLFLFSTSGALEC